MSDAGELAPLRDLGIRALVVVAKKREASFDAFGNSIPLESTFVRQDGTRASMVDAFFRYRP